MSGWKKTMLETGIDGFLELVASKGSINAKLVADELSLSEETVESWADILSKEGLVSTEYDKKGNLVIMSTTKNTKEKEKHIKELTTNVQADIINIEANVHSKEKTLKNEEKMLKGFEKILEKDLEKTIQIDEEYEKIKVREKEILEIFTAMGAKEKELKKDSFSIKKIVDEKTKSIKNIEKELKNIEKEKVRLLEDIELIKKISKVLNVPAEDMNKKIQNIEDRVLEIRKLNNSVNKKYGIVKKLFSKI